MENFIEFLYSKFLQSDEVSIDTRTLEPGNLFFSIKGPNFNGNQYANLALKNGAAFAVIDEEVYKTDDRMILAPDAYQALVDLAVFHRSRYKRKMIAITGSNGKTTTKELIARVLAKKYIVHATQGNLNNHLGVPLTLLQIHPQVEAAVIEMGANHVGEIAQLCEIAKPLHGLITNIGEAHTETFGGIEGVLRGKSELFDFLRKTEGIPIINTSDTRVAQMAKRFSNPITFPQEDVTLISSDPFLRVRIGGLEATTCLVGSYNYSNIASAVAVGRAFEINDEDILEAIATYLPSNQRSQLVQRAGYNLVIDAYNANPTSMKAAIQSLAGMNGPRVAILGDMKEVENAPEKHKEIGEFLKEMKIEKALLVGEQMRNASLSEEFNWFESKETLHTYLKANPVTSGTVLIKGSRGMKMESVLEFL